METKFNSQICTTREQSERLLALGLKKETADMAMRDLGNGYEEMFINAEVMSLSSDIIPAWSLHRLLCMLEKHPYEIYLDANVYDDVIDDIAEAIRIDEFNKDYIRYFIGVDVGEDDF